MSEAVVFIIRENRRFLTEERPLSKSFDPGLRVIPGGNVDPGESQEEALIRECEEELSIHPTRYKFICSLIHSKMHDMVLHYYFIEKYEGKIQANEAQTLVWVAETDVATKLDLPVDKVALHELRRLYE